MTHETEPTENSAYTGPETKGWWRPVCYIPVRLDGKIAIVTGANSGIGKSVTAEIARRGATVIMACRDLSKAQAAKDDLLVQYGVDNPDSVKKDVADPSMSDILSPIKDELLILEQIDMSSFESIRNFVTRIKKLNKPIDFLVNNAGIFNPTYEESADGHELHLAVNFLGPVLLTELLLPELIKAPQARIVNVSSMLHFNGSLYKPTLHLVGADYGPYVAYSQSKLALTMYTVELGNRLQGTKVAAVSLHPGTVKTELRRNSTTLMDKMFSAFLRPQEITPWEAAQTIIHALLRRKPQNGGYYDNYEKDLPARLALSEKERNWLWGKTKEMLHLEQTAV
ncbi:Retinol dehydrogenase 12 [Fasciola gigantica]|uniref:Retinol dehydrogenase 12 n=1 Tax=Fasciola gigantica TaxID=46835 RepID=A0A504YAT2_FASGI|nr:Retinol dehydrogenase 12 [Fasciola gigantica]